MYTGSADHGRLFSELMYRSVAKFGRLGRLLVLVQYRSDERTPDTVMIMIVLRRLYLD